MLVRDCDRHGNCRNPTLCVFVQNGGRLTRNANGGPARWTKFEIKIHESVGGRLYLICKYRNKHILVFNYSRD
jgi:hypothetical protein